MFELIKNSYKIIFVGRPNVGKSTLFNRLLNYRKALVHNKPGVTRDRVEAQTNWMVKGNKFPVLLVDTGGIGGEYFKDEIIKQIRFSISSADLILLLFDAQTGLTPSDQIVLQQVRESIGDSKRHIPIVGVVNKVDVEVHEALLFDFYSTGLNSIVTVSAEHGRGIEDLKLELYNKMISCPVTILPECSDHIEHIPKITIVGRPNVGKSTFINALLNENRMITSSIPGTTIDSVDSLVKIDNKPYLVIDTAGIRKKSKTKQGVEVLSVVLAQKALERSDLAILLLDGETGITTQDEKIAAIIEKHGCSVILAVNKWDTQKRNFKFTKMHAATRVRDEMKFLKYAPIVFMSALEKQGFETLGNLIEKILKERKKKISTHVFTEWIRTEATVHNPKNAKFFMCHQTGSHPPSFACHVNDPTKIDSSLNGYFMNSMRKRWGFTGSPIRLYFIKHHHVKSRFAVNV
ncbi:MAG: ribosome biogenesis GTPase Der [Deltaproteobacteria bacterium]|nr:ribosome biogenesis GTPase Der [Deltaproteobacteria bacterium]